MTCSGSLISFQGNGFPLLAFGDVALLLWHQEGVDPIKRINSEEDRNDTIPSGHLLDRAIIFFAQATLKKARKKKELLKYYQDSMISECIHPELVNVGINFQKY